MIMINVSGDGFVFVDQKSMGQHATGTPCTDTDY